MLVEGEMLGEGDGDEVFPGVDADVGGGSAVPAEGALGSEEGTAAGIKLDFHAEAETLGGVMTVVAVTKADEVVGGHEFDGFAPEDARAVEGAAVQEHLGEAGVIVDGGEEACAAAFDAAAGLGPGAENLVTIDERVCLTVAVGDGDALEFFGGEIEAGVLHAKGAENVFLEEIAECLAGNAFDERAEDIGVDAVAPGFAGMVLEGKLADFGDEVVEARAAPEIGAAVEFGEAGASVEIIDQAAGVGEEVLDGDGGFGGFELGIISGAAGHDLHFLELGEVVGHGVVEVEAAFLEEDEDTDAGNDFGHGIDAADGIALHGEALLEIAIAEGLHVSDAAVAGEEGDDAGVFVLIDKGADSAMHDFEAMGVEAGTFGGGFGELGVEACRGEQSGEREEDCFFHGRSMSRGGGGFNPGFEGRRLVPGKRRAWVASSGAAVHNAANMATEEFKFNCPECGQKIAATPELSGREIECPACKKKISIPSPPEDESAEGAKPAATITIPKATPQGGAPERSAKAGPEPRGEGGAPEAVSPAAAEKPSAGEEQAATAIAPKEPAAPKPVQTQIAVLSATNKLEMVRAVKKRISDPSGWVSGKTNGTNTYATKADGKESVDPKSPEAARFSLIGAFLLEFHLRQVISTATGRRRLLDEEIPEAIGEALLSEMSDEERERSEDPLAGKDLMAISHAQSLAALGILEDRYSQRMEQARAEKARTKLGNVRLGDLVKKLEAKDPIASEDIATALYHELMDIRRRLERVERRKEQES